MEAESLNAAAESENYIPIKLDDLPDEILIHISKWLPRVSDIIQLSRLSQRFVALASDEVLFHNFLVTKWGMFPQRADERKRPNQSWKETTLDCELLIGSWHGHASQVRDFCISLFVCIIFEGSP